MTHRDDARQLFSRLMGAYNRKDRETTESLYAEDIVLWSSLGVESRGKTEALSHLDQLFAALPDEQMRADTVITDGKTLVVEATSVGTDQTGRDYEISFTEVIRMDGGQITEIRTYLDPDDVESISR